MYERLERSSRYWYHTFVTSDGTIFEVPTTRTMAEHSSVIRTLVHSVSEIRKPSYSPIHLPFCTRAEFEMFKEYLETPGQRPMSEKINFNNLDAWCTVGEKFQVKLLSVYCIYFIIYEVHDCSPDLDYVLRLAKIACKHRMKLAFNSIVRFYRNYHPNILENKIYIERLSQVISKSAVAILRFVITQHNKWVERFSGNKCRFCNGTTEHCPCDESKVPEAMWEEDFDEI